MLSYQIKDAEGRARAAICKIAEASLPHSSLVLFGSRARGDFRRRSDFDLAVVPKVGFNNRELLEFSELLDRSAEIIYSIDLVDMRDASDELKAKVSAEGRIWKN
jgi:predicted nucleotidyltransferase